MRQHDVLGVGDAQLVKAVFAAEIGHHPHLFTAGITGDPADRLEADRGDHVAGLLMRGAVAIDPQREVRVRAIERIGCSCIIGRIGEVRLDPLQFGQRRLDPLRQQVGEFFLDLAGVFVLAQFVDQDLDARLVLVVAAAIAVVDPQAGLGIGDQLIERHEFAHQRRDHRGAAHAATNVKRCADFTGRIADHPDADIVQLHRRAVSVAGDHCNLELAWQHQKFGVKARPLPQQFGIGARIDDLVGGGPGVLVRTDVADAIAAGLDRVHFDFGQLGQQIGRLIELDPVVLDVLAGREVTVAAIVLVGDIAQRAHLRRAERAIRNGDAQHIGVELQVEPVLQAQRLEVILAQVPFKAALHLVAEFLNPGIDHRLVIRVIFIHQITQSRASASAGLRVRSGRTVGPSARMRSLMWAGRTPSSSLTASIA